MKLLKHPVAWAVLLVAASALAFQAARTVVKATHPAPAALAGLVPQGALLSIESPNLGALLKQWNKSPEEKAWLASDNYSVFSNSRLLGRLTDAEGEFADASGITASDLLPQVAGRQSIFAWYDIGNLEFLYITRLSPAEVARTELVKSRAKWKVRQSNGITFYLRSATAEGSSTKRTVAFATSGDLLFLATREDLMANSLKLLAHPSAADALPAEPWFADASSALKPQDAPPMLHMVLNLDRLVPSAYFRSYWVQRNVTAMRLYRTSVSDLYDRKGSFEEQRALLTRNAPTGENADVELESLTVLAPAGGVYRASGTSDPAAAVTALEEKLLGRETLAKTVTEDAPDPSLSTAQAGSVTDLETRIDTPAPVSETFSNQGLTAACQAAGLTGVLTWSSAELPATATGLWVPIHSAVILRGTHPWVAQAVATALQQSLRGSLTASNLGIDFTSQDGIYRLSGPKALVFTIRGNDLLLADDARILQQMGKRQSSDKKQAATLIAGFEHNGQHAPFVRLTSLIDGTNHKKLNATGGDETDGAPAFFSTNMSSLSNAFKTLQSEKFIEFHEGPVVRQTVTYQWQTP